MKRFAIVLFIAILFLVAAGLFVLYGDLVLAQVDELLAVITGSAVRGDWDLIELTDGTAAALPDAQQHAGNAASDIDALARQITAGAVSDYEKLEAVYDWMTENIAYDLDKVKDMQAYGAGAEYLLRTRKGVCHDYAALTLALLKAAGIEATYESGDVYPSAGKVERHAWNHARVGGLWYALDTTWGSGFIIEEENRFVQRPRRIYLANPEEMYRLHSDPAYKEEQELIYRRAQAAAAAPVFMSEYEQRLIALFNGYRSSAGLPALAAEERLTELARQSAAQIATAICSAEDYSLEELGDQLNRRGRELRLKTAGMYAFSQWAYPHSSPEKLYADMIKEQQAHLSEPAFRSVAVGVIRKGDLTTVIHIYIENY